MSQKVPSLIQSEIYHRNEIYIESSCLKYQTFQNAYDCNKNKIYKSRGEKLYKTVTKNENIESSNSFYDYIFC